MSNFGNVFLGIGAFIVFLSIVFYFVAFSTNPLLIYPYRSQALITAVIGFILVVIGIVITFIDHKTSNAKTPRLVRNTTLKGTPLTSKDSVFEQKASKQRKSARLLR